jgi:ribosome maturation factor RimP
MIPRKKFDELKGNFVYIYVRNVEKEFGGKIVSIDEFDILTIEDKNNNLVHIPLSEILIVTERR